MKGHVLGAGDVSMKSPERIPVLVDLCSGGGTETINQRCCVMSVSSECREEK